MSNDREHLAAQAALQPAAAAAADPAPVRAKMPWRRSWAALVSAALAVQLAACGGGSGGGDGTGPQGPGADTPALKPSAPGDLTSYVQRVLRERATQRRAGQPVGDGRGSVVPVAAPGAVPAAAPAAAFSSTLTQERDVDEPDFVKTDGTHLYSLDLQDAARPLMRSTRRTAAGALEERAALPLGLGTASALSPRGLVLAGDGKALTVASETWTALFDNPCVDICPPALLPPGPVWVRQTVAAERIDVTDPARPAASKRLEFDGRLIDARRVGDHLVLVIEYQPLLAADQLPADAPAADREAAIAATRGADLLPRLRLPGGSAAPLLAETDCWVQPANASLALAITTITVLDLRAADLAPASRCFIGGSEAMYMTTQAIYLASTRWAYISSGGVLRYPGTMRTDIHKFAFDAGRLSYRASGEVEGHLGWDAQRKSYRLGEHEGALRVLSFTGQLGWLNAGDAATTPPSPATLTVLREAAGSKLEAVATLPNARRPQALGKPGEQVHGVRFAGTRGYVVTFRQIDPLYVLDLTDAADPRIAGVLEAPGFSDHLLPLSDTLLLGVGKDADVSTGRAGGVKVSLFDVADASRPRELASRVFGSGGSQSGLDQSRQGLTMLQQGNVMRVATPLYLLDANFTNPRDALQRLEVDLAARTLLAKPALAPPATTFPPGDLGRQRSVMIGDDLVWLHAGRLSSRAW